MFMYGHFPWVETHGYHQASLRDDETRGFHPFPRRRKRQSLSIVEVLVLQLFSICLRANLSSRENPLIFVLKTT